MKTTQTTQKLATTLGAIVLALLVVPSLAQAGGHGSNSGSGRSSLGSNSGRGGMDNASGHHANDIRRGGADDPAGHNANDNRSVVRGADDPAGHDANKDDHKRRHGGGGR